MTILIGTTPLKDVRFTQCQQALVKCAQDALDERELACVHYRHCGHSTSYQHGIIGELYNGRSGTAVQGGMWKVDRSPRRPRLVLLARRVPILTPNPHPENSVSSGGTPSFEQLECRHSWYLCKRSGRSTRFLQQ